MHFLPLVTFPQSSIDELTDQFQNCNQRVATATTALRTMINRLIIRFSINGERTPWFALTLPVATFSIVSVIDSSSPARAPKPAPPDVLARTCNLFIPVNDMPERTCLKADTPSIYLYCACRNIISAVLFHSQL